MKTRTLGTPVPRVLQTVKKASQNFVRKNETKSNSIFRAD